MWIKKLPAQGGFYWMKHEGEGYPASYRQPSLVQVYYTCNKFRFFDIENGGYYDVAPFVDALWYGPLQPPDNSASPTSILTRIKALAESLKTEELSQEGMFAVEGIEGLCMAALGEGGDEIDVEVKHERRT